MGHERAGSPADTADLVDVAHLVTAYYTTTPDLDDPAQRVAFGTSGHRGSSLSGSFNEAHIAATTQAICEYRTGEEIQGPLFIGRDTHGLSEPAWSTALEVLAANGVTVLIDEAGRYTPTPAISHAILKHNAGRLGSSGTDRGDGIVVTPSHNPPSDGGFKYNPPHGGPADTDATGWIAARANELLAEGNRSVQRVPLADALAADSTQTYDFCGAYVDDLDSVLDMDVIRDAGIRIGADPLGGASVDYWGRIAETHRLDLTVVNPLVDPTWRFMTLDWDGKIRMDCSSPDAMASLIANRDAFQISTGNDADADRHGIVTPDGGLMNPNHFLAVAIAYLFSHRDGWSGDVAIGKTLVSSSMIDRVAAGLNRRLIEVPVGFKWFVPGLLDGSVGFGGEESAGASFLRRDGSTWTTDKDGVLLALLAAEIMAVTGSSPSELYRALAERHGDPAYARVDAPATREEKAILAELSPDQVTVSELAGEPITSILTAAPGNDAAIGGLKVTTESAWFAARPSGTEDVYKIYAESFEGPDHLAEVQAAARAVVSAALGGLTPNLHRRGWAILRSVQSTAMRRIELPPLTEDFTADPVELFFDLAYVFAFSQLVGALIVDPTWAGVAKVALLFGLLWLPWQQLTWAANAVSGNGRPVRLLFLAATVVSIPMAAATSSALEGGGPVFAISLAGIMLIGFRMQTLGAVGRSDYRDVVWGWIAPNLVAIAVLIVGSFFDGNTRIVLWLVTAAIVLWAMIRAGEGEWPIHSGHFAERHGLIVIIALGEVIVAIGIPVVAALQSGDSLPAATVAALLAAGTFAGLLWWAYFDRPSPGLEYAASQLSGLKIGHYVRDVYTWAHAPIVAGVILSAAALEEIALHPEDHVELPFRLMLAGGLALFLTGVAVAVWRAFRAPAIERLVGGIVIAGMALAGGSLQGVVLLSVVVMVLVVVLYAEHRRIERLGLHADREE